MGAANIALKNVRAISLAPNSEIVAIASRSITKASDFLDKAPVSDVNKARVQLHGSYEALLADKNVDAVYLPLPTSTHIIWAVKAADAGKHILLEKPCALSNVELLAIIEACRRNSVVFMDGVMYMHHERLTKIRKCLSDPLFGIIKRVSSSFSFNSGDSFLKDNIRANAALDSLGALGDLGWYQIRLGIIAMNYGAEFQVADSSGSLQINSVPISCRATCGQYSPGGVPMECEGVVTFRNPKSTTGNSNSTLHFDCSFVLPFRQNFEVLAIGRNSSCGDKIMRCDDFVIPRNPSQVTFDMETLHPSGSLVGACLDRSLYYCIIHFHVTHPNTVPP